jgi:hypothetical protein
VKIIPYRNDRGGAPNLMNRFTHRCVDRALPGATRKAKVRQRFLEAQEMLKPPTELFKPGVVARVIWSLIGDAFRQAKDEGRKMAEVEAAPRLRERASPSKF